VVFKVVDGPSGGKVAQRADVKIGMRVPGKVEILDGLAAGESVVVAGQARLMRGENLAVRVVDLNRPRGPGGPGGGRPGAAASAPATGAASRPAGPPGKA
jgi:membrane fusion protein (multidrug efflux system)